MVPTPSPSRSAYSYRHPFPRVFSACSRRQLRTFFRKGGGACLSNTPGPGLLVLPTRCGNGFVEAGEECDCSSDQVRLASRSLGSKVDPLLPASPRSGLLRHHVFCSFLSDSSAQTPAALPTTAPCVRGRNALTAIAVHSAW